MLHITSHYHNFIIIYTACLAGEKHKDVRHHSESLLKEENFRYLKATTKLRASSLPSF